MESIKQEASNEESPTPEPMEQDAEEGFDQGNFNCGKKFICVEYPAIVQNVDKMLETLGGETKISGTFSASSRRLELKFRPEDIYCKPAFADKHTTVGVVLKVRIKRKKKKAATKAADNIETSISSVDILGVCEEIFKFESFVDFQFLPVKTDDNGVAHNIYDDIIPDGPVDLSWLENPSDYFLLPSGFSRIDTTEGYKYSMTNKDTVTDRNIIGRTRQPRNGFTKLCTFSDIVPDRPFKGAATALKIRLINESLLTELKQMFESRPIWSRHALLRSIKADCNQLKHMLPSVAFYYTSGPWRVMWVRYGFDPKIDPSARIYQTLDFRAKLRAPYPVGASNRYSYMANKMTMMSKKKTALISNVIKTRSQEKKTRVISHIFEPGMIPNAKQLFYQYCDIHVPEIQAMLARLPEPGPDAVCNEKTGWLPTSFDERCREIMHGEIAKALDIKFKKTIKAADPGDTDSDDDEWLDDSDDSDYE